jgi:RNA polymerase sigma factor (sigma-70 family)
MVVVAAVGGRTDLRLTLFSLAIARSSSSSRHINSGERGRAHSPGIRMSPELALHRNSLYYFILRRVRDPWISEDLVQETLARLLAYMRAQTVTDARALGFQIATNLVRDHFRTLNRSRTEPLSEDLVSETPPHEQTNIQQQRIDAFSAALAAMPPLRREVFVRRRLHGQSYAEIGSALNMSPGAVEKHVVRALEWLHQQIARHDRMEQRS